MQETTRYEGFVFQEMALISLGQGVVGLSTSHMINVDGVRSLEFVSRKFELMRRRFFPASFVNRSHDDYHNGSGEKAEEAVNERLNPSTIVMA